MKRQEHAVKTIWSQSEIETTQFSNKTNAPVSLWFSPPVRKDGANVAGSSVFNQGF